MSSSLTSSSENGSISDRGTFNDSIPVMLRFKIKEQIAEKEFRDGRRVTLAEIAGATGIHRMTLSKLVNHRGASTVSDNLDKLCAYFDCRIEDLVEYIKDSEVPSNRGSSPE